MKNTSADVVIVGGGLSGCLTALRLDDERPDLRIRVVEAGNALGGNHTWSFFETDLTREQAARLDSMIAHRWPGYEVRFHDKRCTLTTGYRSVTSERLRAVMQQRLPGSIMLDSPVASVLPDRIALRNGTVLHASCVIDARGGRRSVNLDIGFQKFLGQEVVLAAPHGATVPIVMDATVTQNDGFRFVYTLPLDERRLLIEDTYYSNAVDLPSEQLRRHIAEYALAKGWTITEVVREERGILPIILSGDHARFASENEDGAPRIGLAGALFHPTTGYSLPDAVRVADLLAAHLRKSGTLTSADVGGIVHRYGRSIWHQRRYYRFLNRMLLQAAEPGRRHTILARFYGLDQALIERFYAGEVVDSDKLRIGLHMLMKPPIPITSALACLSETRAFRAFAG